VNPNQQEENYRAAYSVNNPVPTAPGFWSAILSALSAIGDFFIPSAEAASFHISSGPSTLPGGKECTPYSVSISASGGTGNYSWSIISGSLPPGLKLAGLYDSSTPSSPDYTPSITISGTPTAAATSYDFTIQAADSGGNTDTKNYSIVVSSAGLQITTSIPLSDGILANPYTTDIRANGVCGPYTWSMDGRPGYVAGESGTPSTTISGTPDEDGTYLTIQVAVPVGNR
jgi:hypothetical protein